jgi:hypothetical protein
MWRKWPCGWHKGHARTKKWNTNVVDLVGASSCDDAGRRLCLGWVLAAFQFMLHRAWVMARVLGLIDAK